MCKYLVIVAMGLFILSVFGITVLAGVSSREHGNQWQWWQSQQQSWRVRYLEASKTAIKLNNVYRTATELAKLFKGTNSANDPFTRAIANYAGYRRPWHRRKFNRGLIFTPVQSDPCTSPIVECDYEHGAVS